MKSSKFAEFLARRGLAPMTVKETAETTDLREMDYRLRILERELNVQPAPERPPEKAETPEPEQPAEPDPKSKGADDASK